VAVRLTLAVMGKTLAVPMSQAVLVAVVLACVAGLAGAQDLQRGFRNYQELLEGRRKLEQLTLAERDEVLIIFRRIRQRDGGRSSQCRDAQSRSEDAASDLATYSQRLRSCAEAQDFSNDCSSEFRRVRNAFSHYESAVSDVSSYRR
jgi:hypothetical protein